MKKIQLLLDNKGYSLNVDGVYGKETKNAVIDFQINNNLKIDGVVGPETYFHLLLANGVSQEEAYINSRDFYSNTDYLIWVDLINFKTNIFQGDNRKWKLIRRYLSAIGKPETPTIPGTFTVKYKGEKISAPYGYEFKWYTQYDGNYLFHSILYNYDGTVYDGRLGMKISDGCIRLKTEDAKYIYDHIPSGTLVVIK